MALITTTLGMREANELHRLTGTDEDAKGVYDWVEYRELEGGPVIHRSVHVKLKQVAAEGVAAVIT